ncbi:PIN domain-containing protein [Planctomycetota bacterium]|nr:PIN domain-containing protein [Planctomycetota bacterium]
MTAEEEATGAEAETSAPRRLLVLDTSALSVLWDDRKAAHGVARQAFAHVVLSHTLVVPALVLYENRRGLEHAGAATRLRRLDQLLRTFSAHTVSLDDRGARLASTLWAQARSNGLTHGEIDLLVLACAVNLALNLAPGSAVTLVSHDGGFPRHDAVSVVRWDDLLLG